MKQPLLVNENIPVPALRRLRAAGRDVVAVAVAEVMPGASDHAVLTQARDSGRWLVTFDRDYGELVFLRNLPSPPAIIYLRQEPITPELAADWILGLLADLALEAGFFITLGGGVIRQRRLLERA